MDYKQKLLDLHEENGWVGYKEPKSASDLISLWNYNIGIWRRIESSGSQRAERVWDLISMVLAEFLQPVAR